MRWLDGIIDSMDEFEQAPGVVDGQGSLLCCRPWGHKELDMTELRFTFRRPTRKMTEPSVPDPTLSDIHTHTHSTHT